MALIRGKRPPLRQHSGSHRSKEMALGILPWQGNWPARDTILPPARGHLPHPLGWSVTLRFPQVSMCESRGVPQPQPQLGYSHWDPPETTLWTVAWVWESIGNPICTRQTLSQSELNTPSFRATSRLLWSSLLVHSTSKHCLFNPSGQHHRSPAANPIPTKEEKTQLLGPNALYNSKEG